MYLLYLTLLSISFKTNDGAAVQLVGTLYCIFLCRYNISMFDGSFIITV